MRTTHPPYIPSPSYAHTHTHPGSEHWLRGCRARVQTNPPLPAAAAAASPLAQGGGGNTLRPRVNRPWIETHAFPPFPRFDELIAAFNEYRRSVDPLCGPAKQATMIPLRTAATLALHRRCRLLLRALGEHVPPEWDRAEQQQANDAVGDVDLVLDEQVEADQAEGGPIEELFDSACSIQEELFEVEVMQESPEDQVIAHNYTLKEGEVSAELA